MTELANVLWRDHVIPGVASSGSQKPEKSKIRQWGTWLESLITTGGLGDNWKATQALLDADLVPGDGEPGIVYDDSTASNNGVYLKVGATTTGSWSQILDFIPGTQFVKAANAGAGTADAIVATTSPTLSASDGAQLVLLNITATNTTTTPTVAFDGGSALTIIGPDASALQAGDLPANGRVLGTISGSNFVLVVDVTSANNKTAAETAQAAAEAAENAAEIARQSAEDDAILAAASAAASQTAAEASGDVKFYDTYADANTDLGNLTEGQVVAIFADENYGSGPTRYRVESSALVFKLDLAQFDRLMELDQRKPRKLWAKMFEMLSTVERVNWAGTGDSLASRKFSQFAQDLDRLLGGDNGGANNPLGNNISTSAGDQLYYADLVNATSITGSYGVVPTGAYHDVAAGGSFRFTYGGVDPSYSKVRVFYIKESGAGTINLIVNGVTVDTADADQVTTELGILEHDLTTTQSPGTTTISVTGGTVKVLGATKLHEDQRGLVKHHLLAAGGITPSGMMQTTVSRKIYRELLAAMGADIITLEMDDNFGDGGVNAAALENMLDDMTTAAPYADKLLIGSTPRAADDNGKLLANLHLRKAAQERGAAFLYFDSYKLMGSYSEMTQIFGSDDGVHPNTAASDFAAQMLWNHLGLSNANLGQLHRRIRTPDEASSLYHGTEIRAGVSRLEFNSDNTFGYDWEIGFNRALSFTDLSGTIKYRFSNNTAVYSNIMPEGFEFGDASGRSVDFTDGNTYDNHSINFKDTGNASGYSSVQGQAFRSIPATKAELIATFGPAHAGTIRYCSDGRADGQGCFVYANSQAGWRRISDDVVLS